MVDVLIGALLLTFEHAHVRARVVYCIERPRALGLLVTTCQARPHLHDPRDSWELSITRPALFFFFSLLCNLLSAHTDTKPVRLPC